VLCKISFTEFSSSLVLWQLAPLEIPAVLSFTR